MTKLTKEQVKFFIETMTDDMHNTTQHEIAETLLSKFDECESFQAKLLAYEQAAEKPYGYLEPCDFPRTTATVYPEKDKYAFMPLYAAPVLPKQPELVENLKKVMNSWLAMEPKLAFQPEFTDVMMLLDAEPAPAQPVSEPYKSAANDIIAERQRQIIEEGWKPEHDDEHDKGELAMAAVCYINETGTVNRNGGKPWGWPWGASWWKPDTRRRNLVKAGALILAEIERLDRAAPAQESE